MKTPGHFVLISEKVIMSTVYSTQLTVTAESEFISGTQQLGRDLHVGKARVMNNTANPADFNLLLRSKRCELTPSIKRLESSA